MTDAKKVNYSEAQTAEMLTRYDPDATEAERAEQVEQIAADFGKTVRSVRQKLVREDVYVAKAYKTKTGAKPEAKSEIVSDIAGALGVAGESVASLEKANKTTLQLIRGTLVHAREALDS